MTSMLTRIKELNIKSRDLHMFTLGNKLDNQKIWLRWLSRTAPIQKESNPRRPNRCLGTSKMQVQR